MPGYTILFMRRDATDRRPKTLHIGVGLFWFLILTAVLLPVAGFLISFGILAPTWLKLDFKSMQESVAEAKENLQPLQKQNADLAAKKQQLETQLQSEREARASAEAEVTMSRTARLEAANRMAEMEGELITLKKSLAVYEKMLKPKLERELVQCVNFEADYDAKTGVVDYKSNFAKMVKSVAVPNNLSVRVSVHTGDNAMAMQQGENASQSVTHTLDLTRSSTLKGTLNLPAAQAEGTTRVIDIKVSDGSKPVGYCWKAF
jgi:hypothetical protein